MASGLPVDRQKLVYKGRTMKDYCLLSEYNLEEGSKVHLILQKTSSLADTPIESISSSHYQESSTVNPGLGANLAASTDYSNPRSNTKPAPNDNQQSSRLNSRFEQILKQKLAQHFCPTTLDKIMHNLHEEIERDIHSSSLDDLERLAKQKLNISSE